MLLGGLALKGYAIRSHDGRIGTVSDLLFDDTKWTIRWLVVDTGVWLPGRKVLLHPSAVSVADHALRELAVNLTQAQVKDSPDISQDEPVSRAMQNSLYGYYGWDPVWSNGYYGVGAMATPLSTLPYGGGTTMLGADQATRLDDADPHLRSMSAVTGYHILASDGTIGHVETIMIDDAAWTVRYLVVDTRNWWAGREVLVSLESVAEIVWADRQIRVNITRAQISASPPWDGATVIDAAYESNLREHYGWRTAL